MPTTDRLQAALSDRYAIERPIGSGGMATVYLARDLKHDREVALKVLRADLSAVIGTERFLSEVRIAAKLDHPHILTLIDSGEADGLLYYVLPYVRGESLRAKLEREKQLGMDEALSITKQVASALDYAHAQGVVHRDIKPENILLHEGEAVLTDFGIALAVKEAGGNRLTETGLSLGTPQYMSPEQATGDRTLDKRSDIYSLGAVYYEMIAGEPPVTGATAQVVIAKLLTEKPVRLSVVRSTISPSIDRAIDKALAKVPADRFKSAGEFARALEAAAPLDSPTSARSLAPKLLIGAGAALILVLGALLLRGKMGSSSAPVAVLRDRSVLTNSGRVRVPSISPDGKTLAYVVTDCRVGGCRYGIELQDVDGSASRRLLDGATAVYGIDWSSDRRNLLLRGTVGGRYGTFLISTLGGAARYVAPQGAGFWAGGDSLVFPATSAASEVADKTVLMVSGLDGTPRDSISVNVASHGARGVTAVPASKWMVLSFDEPTQRRLVSFDRSGSIGGTTAIPLRLNNAAVSSDAVWCVDAGVRLLAIVRIPFDATSGRFGSARDSVYSGHPTGVSVTADGSSLVFDEGTTQWSTWALTMSDIARGDFPENRRLFVSTARVGTTISPDGNRILLLRSRGILGVNGGEVSVMPFDGGPETPVASAATTAFWADDSSIVIASKSSSGMRLSLVNPDTRAERSRYDIADSAITDMTPLANGGWAWISADRRTITTGYPGQSNRKFAKPSWVTQAISISASPDRTRMVYAGWLFPNEDSLVVGTMEVATGVANRLIDLFVENGSAKWNPDQSIRVIGWDTQESATVSRLTLDGKLTKIGSVARPAAAVDASADLKRAVVLLRDYRGDAWMAKVVRQ